MLKAKLKKKTHLPGKNLLVIFFNKKNKSWLLEYLLNSLKKLFLFLAVAIEATFSGGTIIDPFIDGSKIPCYFDIMSRRDSPGELDPNVSLSKIFTGARGIFLHDSLLVFALYKRSNDDLKYGLEDMVK